MAKLSDFTPQKKNANKHTEYGGAVLDRSMEEVGWITAITSANDGEVFDGSRRLEKAYEKFGDVEPIVVESDGTRPVIVKRTDIENAQDPRAIRAGIAANRVAELSLDWDMEVMGDLLGEDDAVLDGLFNDEELIDFGLMEEPEGQDAEPRKALAERFIVPPFSVLDARQGYWQDRKRAWLELGLQSEVGRDVSAIVNTLNDKYEYFSGRGKSETSIFDPVLTEICYRWFCPDAGTILDPFAGGSVRGIIAAHLGYKYTGIDLSENQIVENRKQADDILSRGKPEWIVGDSNENIPDEKFDFVFSCPPYGNLEVYSDKDEDISNMEHEKFISVYSSIIKKSVAALKDNRFACFVVGDFRDKKGFYRNFVSDTIKAFQDAGAILYNEIVLVTMLGSLPIRAAKAFNAGRKAGKTHQNVLVFYKGNPRAIKEIFRSLDLNGLDDLLQV